MTPAATTAAGRAASKREGVDGSAPGGPAGPSRGHRRVLRPGGAGPRLPRRVSGPTGGRSATATPARPDPQQEPKRPAGARPGSGPDRGQRRSVQPPVDARLSAPAQQTQVRQGSRRSPRSDRATTRARRFTSRHGGPARPPTLDTRSIWRGERAIAPWLPLRSRRRHRGSGAQVATRLDLNPAALRRGVARLLTRAMAALRALPDHRWLDRLVRSRWWIPVLGVMLTGVVALQVEVLKYGAGDGRAMTLATELQSRDQLLRLSIAQLSDDQRIEQIAGRMGMVMAGPTSVDFVSAGQSGSIGRAIGGIKPPDPQTFLAALSASAAAAAADGTSGSTVQVSGTALGPGSATGSAASGAVSTSGTTATAGATGATATASPGTVQSAATGTGAAGTGAALTTGTAGSTPASTAQTPAGGAGNTVAVTGAASSSGGAAVPAG